MANRGARFFHRIQKRGEREEPRRIERPSLDGERGENLRQVGGRGERECALRAKIARRLGRPRQQLRDRRRISRGLEPREPFRTHRRERAIGRSFHDPIEFKSPQGAQLHRWENS